MRIPDGNWSRLFLSLFGIGSIWHGANFWVAVGVFCFAAMICDELEKRP
jgi:hypothetical protein